MKIGSAFPSKYLNAEDFKGKGPVQFTIVDCRAEDVGTEQKPQVKPCLYVAFQNVSLAKPIILNKTNAETIAMDLGDETDAWRGHTVEVFLVMVQNPQGQTVPGIRLRVVHPTQVGAAAAPATFAAAPAPLPPYAPVGLTSTGNIPPSSAFRAPAPELNDDIPF